MELQLGKFRSRGGDYRILAQTGKNTFIVYGPSHYTRCAADPGVEGISMFDFEGGPVYFTGSRFPFEDSDTVIQSMRPTTRGEGIAAVEITVISAPVPPDPEPLKELP